MKGPRAVRGPFAARGIMSDMLAYDVDGRADGLALMLIHPLGADRRFWAACRTAFGPGVRTVACDLRGAGRSPRPAGPLTLETSVADLEVVRERIDAERIVVVGCAVGAMIAALYAAQHPERTAALVMANPGIRITEAASADLATRAEKVRRTGMAALLPQALDNAFAGCTDAAARQRYEEHFLAHDAEGYALAALGLSGADLTDALTHIRCPVLLVPGGMDRLFPPAVHAREIAARITRVETVELADGAHFIPYQQPQRFAAAVSAFLDRAGLRQPAG